MPASEAYDVVVVRDPTMTVGAIMKLSRDLAHLTGTKQADVELALQGGRFIVYPGLGHDRVEAAADQLRSMGAVVQIKPAEAPNRIERIEPDRGRPQVNAFDGPVAHFADNLGLDSGEFNTGAGVLPSYNEGIGNVLPSEDGRTNKYEPVPEPGPEDSMQMLADVLDAAAFEAPEIQTIDGMDSDAFDAAEEAAKREAVELPEASQSAMSHDDEVGLDPGASAGALSVSRRMGPPPEESLQLDAPHASSSSMSRPSMNTAPYSGSGSVAPGMPMPSSLSRQDMYVDDVESGLFFEDPVANTLGLVAACCLVTLVLAFGITSATKRSDIMGLEEELLESIRSPLDVKYGDLRAPELIEDELAELYKSSRNQFLLLFSIGIPIGLGLARIKR